MATSAESRAMSISLSVGVGMLVAKWIAFLLTSSSVIFSDAAESVVHIIAVWFAWYAIRVSERPPDAEHQFGHAKIGFVSAGVEGGLICIAAIVIIVSAVTKLVEGVTLDNVGIGTAITAGAGAVNAFLGIYLVRVGKRGGSLIVEANGQHVLTDAWTSAGAVAGLMLASWTNILWLDPAMAILFGANIIREGVRLVHASVNGLMDRTDPLLEQMARAVLDDACASGTCSYHRLRVRAGGQGPHLDFHLAFPDDMSIYDAHTIATGVEERLRQTLGTNAEIMTHLESKTQPDGHE